MCCSTIKFSLKNAHPISLKIFDAKDNLINEIMNGTLDIGNYRIVWNGKDNVGNEVEKGIYYYQVDSSDNLMSIGPIYVK